MCPAARRLSIFPDMDWLRVVYFGTRERERADGNDLFPCDFLIEPVMEGRVAVVADLVRAYIQSITRT